MDYIPVSFPGHALHVEDPQAKENHSENETVCKMLNVCYCGSSINVCLKGKGSEEQLSSTTYQFKDILYLSFASQVTIWNVVRCTSRKLFSGLNL